MPYVVREPDRVLIRGDFATTEHSPSHCGYCAVGWLMREVLGASKAHIELEDSYDEGFCLVLQDKLDWSEDDVSRVATANDAADPEDRIGLLKNIVDDHPDLVWEAKA